MTLYELRSDIELLAQQLKLSSNSTIGRRQIEFWIRKHRARGIREEFARNKYIDPAWLQNMGVMPVTVVNSADDPLIPVTSVNLGRFTLPEVVSLPYDQGVYRITCASNLSQYYPVDMNDFFNQEPGSITRKHKQHFRVGNVHYVSPCTENIRPVLILENPMDGFVINTEFIAKNALEIGENYTVYDTQVVHNAVAYNPGNTFVAVSAAYTGNGKVKLTNMKRRMRVTDPYPMGLTLAEYVTMKVFTEEMQIQRESLADVIQDMQDQLIVLKNPDAVRNEKSSKVSAQD
jgi:hypothetical protein